MSKYTSISKVKAVTVNREPTGQDELDWLYGMSQFSDGDVWGMPDSTISTWVGEGGVGKSRLAISLAKNKVREGKVVLYFQNEVDLPTLASWVNDSELDEFYCSDVTDLSDQIQCILEVEPDIVFVDSINLIDGYGNGNDRVIREIAHAYRQAIKGTRTHVVFLCQLNKDGSAKGSSSLKHLPDIQMLLTNEPNGCFKVSFGNDKPKHRYGRVSSEYHGIWKHTDDGVKCISENRLQDKRWPSFAKSDDVFDPNVIPDIDVSPIEQTPEQISALENLKASAARQSLKISSGGIPPIPVGYSESGVPNTLETCSPLVREAYLQINKKAEPSLMSKVVKLYKKNWSF